MERSLDIPGRGLSETFRQVGEPETRIAVAWAIANDQHPARGDPSREPLQERHLLVGSEIMKKIEKDDIASRGDRGADILLDEPEIAVGVLCNNPGALDFPPITVEPGYRREEFSFAQIKGKQANAAADVDEGLTGRAQ